MRASVFGRAAVAACGVMGVFAGVASGGAMLQPAAVTTTATELQPIVNTISQAGLGAMYESGVTDFDSFVPGTAFPGAIDTAWQTDSSFPIVASFDLGGGYPVDGFAVWQFNNATGVREFELYADDDMDFSNGATQLGGTFEAANTFSFGTGVSFPRTSTRFVHFRALNNHDGGGLLEIGEFAFREADLIECDGDVLFSDESDVGFALHSDQDVDGGVAIERAESVMLADDGVIEHVRFWGGYLSNGIGVGVTPSIDRFELRVFADAGGLPAETPLFVIPLTQKTRTLSGATDTTFNAVVEFEYTAELEIGLLLQGGVTYWVSIVNDTTDSPGSVWGWITADAEGLDTHASRQTSGGSTWEATGGRLSLELCGMRLGADPCPADLNNDGVVDSGDLAVLLAAWGPCP